MTLAARIQMLMNEKPARQADVARAAGVKPPSVSAWLDGTTKSLKGDTLVQVARFFDVHERWLATGRGQKYRSEEAAARAGQLALYKAHEESSPDDHGPDDDLARVALSDVLRFASTDERRKVLDQIRVQLVRARAKYRPEDLGRYLDALDQLDATDDPTQRGGREE